MPKRKAAAISKAKGTSRKRARTRGQLQQLASAARPPPPTLLTLPRELRNMIYSYFTPTINTVFVESAGKGRSLEYNVKADHPLSYVCRQLHIEFSQEVALYRQTDADNVVAHVRDFNFHALLGYLKTVQSNGANLEDFDMRAAENDQPGARRSDRTFAMYEFMWAGDAELAQQTLMQASWGFDMHDNGPWADIYKSFREWYQFRADVEATERFWEKVEKDDRYGVGEMTEEEELKYMEECRKEEKENENDY
ncbi:hypothetical protein KC332_g1206 [Hortaea werneckii]|nr:hypothetical protein KC358_g4671 [Hortaea werneckii]KAI6847279.1 hypothetical protein KC350_g3536 [Hortaea werneckii]KAI6943904.1 hypothetical protein KC341_g1188 [Hortaea werneckii]KAI6947700.1 hypothetical protein KC348_g2391 [Hortaea werneckii]KAI6981762.1 hypothetical protein KC321_g1031 [Hortaea werneckii]